ncbi:uncharacterized protein LOC122623890 [Drosophila teissieri]|uniref:uncharacterized protein LOC122623890 n=1 Tax=Drosophila teissieri TaxID=7243 RepID=UPI001CBA299A|nr:uncharacterized protein LOC122623890 [Drosophila teissieri]
MGSPRAFFKLRSHAASHGFCAAVHQPLQTHSYAFFYRQEYNILQSKGQLPSSSFILNLNPFLDADGIMRSCGRLTASDSLSYDERHPFGLMVRLIRTRYWIPKLRNLIKRVTTTCKACVIHRKKVQSQLMGKLPQSRATYSRPFTHTGLDFAGPFDVKSYSGRACRITKGYVCVFVCFSTKAIHLEATSDLTTEKFLGAFSRFAARRGCPLHLYSDNGKTFVGAEKALTEDFIAAVKEKVTSSFSHPGISTLQAPPIWEAFVLFLSASLVSLRQPCRPIAPKVASSSTDVLEELDRSDAESVRGFIRFGRVRGFSG